jgi:hypothetical protein
MLTTITAPLWKRRRIERVTPARRSIDCCNNFSRWWESGSISNTMYNDGSVGVISRIGWKSLTSPGHTKQWTHIDQTSRYRASGKWLDQPQSAGAHIKWWHVGYFLGYITLFCRNYIFNSFDLTAKNALQLVCQNRIQDFSHCVKKADSIRNLLSE